MKALQQRLSSQVWTLLLAMVVCLSIVSDGWSGKPSPWLHQVLLLPLTLGSTTLLCLLLSSTGSRVIPRMVWLLVPVGLFQVASLGMMAAESHHFERFGYRSTGWQLGLVCLLGVGAGAVVIRYRRGALLLFGVLLMYSSGVVVAIYRFPLNYLRSDMLPVIMWADTRLLHELNPYTTIHVGQRLYDFPYLPGMLVAFLPVLALHWDPRVANVFYLLGSTCVLYTLAVKKCELPVAAALGVFLLCPFLQYRHDLYLEPHWFCLALAVSLQRRGKNLWASFVWGLSCAIYQLSWVLIPFFLLFQWRRFGGRQTLKAAFALVIGAALILLPFLPVAGEHIAHNTVGQWNHLTHALADPMNFSYWITYVVPPADLRWVQAIALAGVFVFCLVRGRCADQTDMLRWMTGSLALFVSMNVLVDGYFYLTVLLLLIMYVCSLNGWWVPEAGKATSSSSWLPIEGIHGRAGVTTT